MQQLVKDLIKSKLISSAHDVSEGGLFITLLESAMPNSLGFSIDTDDDFRKDAFLFGEAQSRIVVSVSPDNLDDFVGMISDTDLDFMNLGEVTDGEILIDGESLSNIKDYRDRYENAISDKMKIAH